jgi:hypothetical protein
MRKISRVFFEKKNSAKFFSQEKAQKVAEFLQNRAAKLSSKVLNLMANRVEANPFAKVIQNSASAELKSSSEFEII